MLEFLGLMLPLTALVGVVVWLSANNRKQGCWQCGNPVHVRLVGNDVNVRTDR